MKEVNEVKMFHFEDWPDNSVPKDINKLLKLMSKVQDCKQRENNQQPMVVMCRYVSGKNFVAALSQIMYVLHFL